MAAPQQIRCRDQQNWNLVCKELRLLMWLKAEATGKLTFLVWRGKTEKGKERDGRRAPPPWSG